MSTSKSQAPHYKPLVDNSEWFMRACFKSHLIRFRIK